MNDLLYKISAGGFVWGICLAVGIIFTVELVRHLKELKETGTIVAKKTRKHIYFYENPKQPIIFDIIGMILGYGAVILVIVLICMEK